MGTILDTTKLFLSSVCFILLPTDVAWENIVFIFSCQVIALVFILEKWRRSPTIMGKISLRFGVIDNDLLHASRHSPEDNLVLFVIRRLVENIAG